MHALLLALTLAAPPVTWQAAVTTEAVERTPEPGEASTVATSELALAPRVGALFGSGEAMFALGYAPRLTLVDPQGLRQLEVLHQATVDATFRPDRTWQLVLGELYARGNTNLTPLQRPATAAAVPADQLPGVSSLDYMGSTTRADLKGQLSRRLELVITPSFSISGGATPSARLELPLERTPRLDTSMSWKIAGAQSLGVAAAAWHTDTSSGPTADVVEASGTWRRQLDERSKLSLAAGAGAYHTSEPGSANLPWLAGPLGLFEYRRGLGERAENLEALAQVSLGPAVDPLTGTAVERVDGIGGVEFTAMQNLRLAERASSGVTLDGTQEGYAQLESTATWTISKPVRLAASARGAYLTSEAPGQASGLQWLASVSVTVVEAGVP
ncbi:MAG: hypothetical protein JST54_26455 [Deltaproteobacteria bacterium]|nr:hypothetical protein [Deltaproteobacteria bacterium]